MLVGLLILINLNGKIKKNVFVAEKLVIERNILIVRKETVIILNVIKRHYARYCKTKLAQNKDKEFNSKRQSVKQLCDRGKSLANDSGFLFVLNARNQIQD